MPQSSILKAPRTGGVRFAPSPTGPFHVGNLRTAWVSYQWALLGALLGARPLDVSSKKVMPWVVRMEDIDRPRVLAGAREEQLLDIAAFGWKPDVLLTQSEFYERHLALFRTAVLSGQAYPCDCSRTEVRKALATLASAPHEEIPPVYSGHCRSLDPKRALHTQDTIAWRFRMPNFSGHDDFIIARSQIELDRDGLPRLQTPDALTFAYHWACAIDDYDGDYDLLVRSHDLATAAPLQRAVQRWVGELEGEKRIPAIFHTTLIVQNDGHRLEKRTQGVTLSELTKKGFTTEKLSEIFAKSFDFSLLSQALPPEAIAGEELAQLSLKELYCSFES